MLFNIMAPEFFLGKALGRFLGARQCTKEIREFQRREKHENDIHWTLTHSHFANMGGVFVKFEPNPPTVTRRIGSQEGWISPARPIRLEPSQEALRYG